MIPAREQPVQHLLELLPQQERARGDVVAHLDEVVDGEVGDRVGVGLARGRRRRRRRRARSARCLVAGQPGPGSPRTPRSSPGRRTGRWRGRRRRSARPDRRRAREGSGPSPASRWGWRRTSRGGRESAGSRRGTRARRTRTTSSGVASAAKLFGPAHRQKRVPVNERSGLGSAIIMNPPRGQMCRALGSSRAVPSAAGGIASSL